MQGRCRAPLAAGPPPARPKCTLHAEAHHRRPLCCPVRPTQIRPDRPCLQTHRNAVVSALGLPLRAPRRAGPRDQSVGFYGSVFERTQRWKKPAKFRSAAGQEGQIDRAELSSAQRRPENQLR